MICFILFFLFFHDGYFDRERGDSVFFLYFILFLSACADLHAFRIPNRLILLGYGAGVLYRLLRPGPIPFYGYLLASFLVYALLAPLFQLRVIGGGDVKLFGICAVFAGPVRTGIIILYAFLAGGIQSVIYLAYRRIIFPHVIRQTKYAACIKKGMQTKNVIHFSVSIFFGALAEHIWGDLLWHIF